MKRFTYNATSAHHAEALRGLFPGAVYLDWWVAFATYPGFKLVRKELLDFLKNGNTARVVIGLDMFHSEPRVLRCFAEYMSLYPNQMKFYLSNGDGSNVFHPKLYMFHYANKRNRPITKTLMGSANLTAGALNKNVEFSTILEMSTDVVSDRQFTESFLEHAEWLIGSKKVVLAKESLIDDYEIRFNFYRMHRGLAEKKAKASITKAATNQYEYFRVLLSEMKSAESPMDFDSLVCQRADSRASSLAQLRKLLTEPHEREEDFLTTYSTLVSPPHHYWHSGELQRLKGSVATDRHNFLAGLSQLDRSLSRKELSPEQAYDLLLQHFALNASQPSKGVRGAGPNVMTEILHSYDNNKYAVLNANSIAGLSQVSTIEFPEALGKSTVDGALYEAFCDEARKLCQSLGLRNFSEFDALMNYDYFR